jgi:Flp pilus assembly protein CpaB
MKWAIVGLTVLGVAAAACAALLVSAIRTGSLLPERSARLDGEVQVLYAKFPLPAMTVVEGDMVASKKMPRSQAPPHSITDPVQVVGRVLTVAVVEGQPFTSNCFASESSASVAAAVGKGKRAVGISVTDYGGLEGLLYPGSVVDVMMSLKEDDNSGHVNQPTRDALATTLLERVQVLAIERQTVVSGSAAKVGDDIESSMRPTKTRRVTLLVDTKQAKILQLAMEQGTLSLAMRNPLDTDAGDADQISLRSIIGGADLPKPDDGKPAGWERALSMVLNAGKEAARNAAAARAPKPSDDPFAASAPPAARWETTVIRGDKSQTYSFPMEGDLKDAAAKGKEAPATPGKSEAPDADGSGQDAAPAAPTPDSPGDAPTTETAADGQRQQGILQQ